MHGKALSKRAESKTAQAAEEAALKKQVVENNTNADNDAWSNKPSGKLEYNPNTIKENLSGQKTPIKPNANAEEIRSLTRENESAEILANYGNKVEQNPPTLPNGKNPDYIINGEVFDSYAPKSSSVRNIWSEVKGKIDEGQTRNVVINLANTPVTVESLREQFRKYPVDNLKKVIVINKAGYPFTIDLGQ